MFRLLVSLAVVLSTLAAGGDPPAAVPTAEPTARSVSSQLDETVAPETSVVELEVVVPAQGSTMGDERVAPRSDDTEVVLGTTVDGGRVESDIVETDAFQTLGLTWPTGTGVGELAPQVRTRGADEWTAWLPLDGDDEAPDFGTIDSQRQERDGSAPLWVGAADAFQLSFAASAAGNVDDVNLSLISTPVDVGARETSTTATRTAMTIERTESSSLARAASVVEATAVSAPRVISRGEWGAQGEVCRPDVAATLVGAVIHHTAGPNSYSSVAEAMAQIRNDQAYHIGSRGWCDIGYNFIVDKWGNIYEGRANSLTSPVIGVHAGGFNTGTVGVSMLGNYETAEPPRAMLDAVAQIVAWRLASYRVDPRGTIAYGTGGGENSRYPAGVVVTLPAVFSHRDVAYTACPGGQVYALLATLRQQAGTHYDTLGDWTQGPSVSPQMSLLWDRWGGPSGPLGVPLEGQRCDLAPVGCLQRFSGASVFWSPATGAQAVGGLILQRWEASGGPAAGVGYPTSTVFGCPSSGCTQTFQTGAVLWSGATGAHLVGGQIYERFRASGGLSAGIGYPVETVLTCDPQVGCTQWFDSGRIAWSAETGAHIVGGAIAARWDALGGPSGALGYPISTQLGCNPDTGCVQHFRLGSISWTGRGGAQAMAYEVRDEWVELGDPSRAAGHPLETVLGCTSTSCAQTFEGAQAVWSPGKRAHFVGGIIRAHWLAAGGPDSALGLPTSTVLACDPTAGCTQAFDRGAVSWSMRTGAQGMPVQIRDRWLAAGGAAAIGYPVESLGACASAGPCEQTFERATVSWSPSAGAQIVGGIIRQSWLSAGGATGPLGLPTSTVLQCDPSAGCVQTFAGGSISWSARAGAVIVR